MYLGSKMLLIGVGTLAAISAPFLNSEVWPVMFGLIFPVKERHLICPSSSFWKCFELFFVHFDITDLRPMWMTLCTVLVLANAVLTVPFMLRRPSKEVLMTSSVICFLFLYMFGYYIHEKHIVYAYLAALLILPVYNDIIALFSVVTAYTNFLMAAYNANAVSHVFIVVVAFLHPCAAQQLLSADPELQLVVPTASISEGTHDATYLRLREWLRRWYWTGMKWLGAWMVPYYSVNLLCEFISCPWKDTFRSIAVYSSSFFVLFGCYIYSWTALYFQTSHSLLLLPSSGKLK